MPMVAEIIREPAINKRIGEVVPMKNLCISAKTVGKCDGYDPE